MCPRIGAHRRHNLIPSRRILIPRSGIVQPVNRQRKHAVRPPAATVEYRLVVTRRRGLYPRHHGAGTVLRQNIARDVLYAHVSVGSHYFQAAVIGKIRRRSGRIKHRSPTNAPVSVLPEEL